MKKLMLTVAALALGSPAYANELINGGFEDPIGSEWTSNIVSGASSSWILGVSSALPHSGTNSYLMSFGPDGGTGEAYLEQSLSGLTPDLEYQVSGWIYFGWKRPDKYWTYIEAQGGGTPVQVPAQGDNVSTPSWQQYFVTQTADSGGNLTVKIDLIKYGTTTGDKTCFAYLDDFVVQVPEPSTMLLGMLGGLGLLVILQRRRSA